MIDLDAFAEPTDSESGDAPYNPDIWTLRDRLTSAIAELRGLRSQLAESQRENAILTAELMATITGTPTPKGEQP